MKNFQSIDDIFDFAIAREIEARSFYSDLAKKIDRPEMSRVLESFAVDEDQHRTKLEAVKAGEHVIEPEEVGSLNIVDYVVPAELNESMTYAELLAFGMEKENRAHLLYSNLSSLARTDEVKELFQLLAQEEAEHKLRLEIEYDLTTF